ncbi:MAG: FAD binding domain-containing protein, partial [Gammaproteobacteria bacterium]|nr:FAD binding domain-containing protein [Gammaproteobacteria bacterium]
MYPAPFRYHRPASLAEAIRLLSELGDGAKPLAGGQTLIPILK